MRKHNGNRSMIGVGSPVVDMVAQVPEDFLISAGGAKGGMELVDAEALALLQEALPNTTVCTPGGSAGNTAFAMARLGIPSRFLGTVGSDRSGASTAKASRPWAGAAGPSVPTANFQRRSASAW